jgi:hypothetical protein
VTEDHRAHPVAIGARCNSSLSLDLKAIYNADRSGPFALVRHNEIWARKSVQQSGFAVVVLQADASSLLVPSLSFTASVLFWNLPLDEQRCTGKCELEF